MPGNIEASALPPWSDGYGHDAYAGIEFASVERLLRVYGEAIVGFPVSYSTYDTCPDLRYLWWRRLAAGTPQGATAEVVVPSAFMEHGTFADNLAWYKSAILQQLGHVEFGSLDFSFDGMPSLSKGLRHTLRPKREPEDGSVQRYLAMFAQPALAARIFAAMENARVNFMIKHHYRGIRYSYRLMQEYARLTGRRPMTLRQAFCDQLEYLEYDPSASGSALGDALNAARGLVEQLCSAGATVDDSAESAVRAYEIALTIPANTPLGLAAQGDPSLRADVGVVPDEFTGDFDTDGLKLHTEAGKPGLPRSAAPMTAADLRELAGKTLRIGSAQQVDRLAHSGLSMADLPRGVNIVEDAQSRYFQAGGAYQQEGRLAHQDDSPNEKIAYYDEWDFRSGRYVETWCCVREKVLGEGDSGYYDRTLEARKPLVAAIRRQFEQLPSEMLYRVRNLEDGDDYDLDMMIAEMIDRRAGRTPPGKVYWKKQKAKRDVAVAFLLDMSGSTADLINKKQGALQYDEAFKYDFMRSVMRPRRRIIDLEKESVVLLMHALEILGDQYAIYGFSGHGRSNVQFLVIKDLDEGLTRRVKQRVDMIAPIHGTRMGPAVRHAAAKLNSCASSLKLLFLVSDGYPQDLMYGRHDDDREYAISDTRMALLEAAENDITPFCLTVDSAGTDYLRSMCPDIGYEVLDDIELLPQRLPALYNKLSV